MAGENVNFSYDSSGKLIYPEGMTEEQKAEYRKKAQEALQNSELTQSLSGTKSSVSSGDANAAGGIFSGLSTNQAELTEQFLRFSSAAVSMNDGGNTLIASLGIWFNAFMNAFGAGNSPMNTFGLANSNQVFTVKAVETPDGTQNSGGTQGTEGAGGSQGSGSTQSADSSQGADKKDPDASLTSEQKAAKKGGYVACSTKPFYKKGGKNYMYQNGEFILIDISYTNGQYVKDGITYNKDGSRAEATVRMGEEPSVYTEEHFKEGGYKVEKSTDGRSTIYTKGDDTYYFDEFGRMTQHQHKNTPGFLGFGGDGSTDVTRYTYNKTSNVASVEKFNNYKGKTIKTEYLSAKGLTAGTTTNKTKLNNQQEFDQNGKIWYYDYVDTTTVTITINGDKAKKVTVTDRQKTLSKR